MNAEQYKQEKINSDPWYKEMDRKFPGFLDTLIDRKIFCPHCGQMVNEDDGNYPVSYWGTENGPVEKECESCEKKFYIIEHVTRTYEVKITND
jgi:hypothetical protein